MKWAVACYCHPPLQRKRGSAREMRLSEETQMLAGTSVFLPSLRFTPGVCEFCRIFWDFGEVEGFLLSYWLSLFPLLWFSLLLLRIKEKSLSLFHADPFSLHLLLLGQALDAPLSSSSSLWKYFFQINSEIYLGNLHLITSSYFTSTPLGRMECPPQSFWDHRLSRSFKELTCFIIAKHTCIWRCSSYLVHWAVLFPY